MWNLVQPMLVRIVSMQHQLWWEEIPNTKQMLLIQLNLGKHHEVVMVRIDYVPWYRYNQTCLHTTGLIWRCKHRILFVIQIQYSFTILNLWLANIWPNISIDKIGLIFEFYKHWLIFICEWWSGITRWVIHHYFNTSLHTKNLLRPITIIISTTATIWWG